MTTPAKIKWEEMHPDEFVAAREAAPVAYLGVGPLEWHSLHLPLGTDVLKAYYHVCGVAEIAGGIVFPPLYLAVNSANRPDLPLKSIADGPELFEAVIEARLDFIASNAFKVIVVMNGHGGQLHYIRAAGARIEEKYGIRVYSTQDDFHSKPGLYEGDHAGGQEASAMLVIRPDLVALEKLPPLPEPLDNDKLIIHSSRPDPRTQSDADYGRRSLDCIRDDLVSIVRDLLAGKTVKHRDEG